MLSNNSLINKKHKLEDQLKQFFINSIQLIKNNLINWNNFIIYNKNYDQNPSKNLIKEIMQLDQYCINKINCSLILSIRKKRIMKSLVLGLENNIFLLRKIYGRQE